MNDNNDGEPNTISTSYSDNTNESIEDGVVLSPLFDHQNILNNRDNMKFFDIDVEENEGEDDGFGPVQYKDDDNDEDDSDSDGEFPVHDQLPSVEEYKTTVQFDATARRQRNAKLTKKLPYLLWGIVVIGVLSIAGIGKEHGHRTAVKTVTETLRLSHPDAFRDKNSPQSKALRWMLHDDTMKLPLPSSRTDAFVQRYVVAVLVFAVTTKEARPSNPWVASPAAAAATTTRNSFGLLSGLHECDWNSEWNRVNLDHETGDLVVDRERVKLGIVCGNANNSDNDNDSSVIEILFPRAGLRGELPPELELLRHLVKVDLDNNDISGTVPPMPYLMDLSLAYNQLAGSLPDHFSEMTRLQTLSLSENALEGNLPRTFAALTDLKILALNGNELTGGLEEVYSMTSLEELYLAYNSFEDSLSNDSFRELSNLKVIDMKDNRLSGPLPDALWKLTNLEVIDVHKNALDGQINDVIVEDHPLKYLDVSSNLLGGGIPSSISHLGGLTHLDLSYNRLERRLPKVYIEGMTKMKTLLVTEEARLGPQPLPDLLRGMTDLKQLSFRLSSRTGTIPTWFGELTHLELLDLDWNHISGTVPTELGNLKNLRYLMLNRNRMTGSVPTEVSTLPHLKLLMIDTNSFTGSVLTGDEDVCIAEGMRRITDFVADCGRPEYDANAADGYENVRSSNEVEVNCPCCTSCCWDSAPRCNMKDWVATLEREFRSGYERYIYSFDDAAYVPVV
mmetsp:Transcript_110851/g.226848  ORF Transcript_110851/g.226848 Transcript_110851/m.226848 type:complete len:733 (+) Transcript_110851:213-2411(+)